MLSANIWQVTTLTATLAGILHGLIWGGIRYRQRWVREMLKDLVKNRLQSIKIMARIVQSPQANPDTVATRLEQVQNPIQDISSIAIGLDW
ncbi:MAG: hypothetical protein Q6J33_02705 [Gloeomargarita sp. DG_2_bins_126]